MQVGTVWKLNCVRDQRRHPIMPIMPNVEQVASRGQRFGCRVEPTQTGSATRCEYYVPPASNSTGILLSIDRLAGRSGLNGAGCDEYFRGLLCQRLLHWVNVFDACLREMRRTHLLRFAGRRPAQQHRRNPDGPEPQSLG